MPSKLASNDEDSMTQSRDESALGQAWTDLREEWLRTQKTRKTRETYERNTRLWLEYLATDCTKDGNPVHPWTASTEHALQWLNQMLVMRPSEVPAIRQRLEACNSWYKYVVARTKDPDDRFHGAFRDSEGNVRMNPFRSDMVSRPPKIAKSDNDDLLSLADITKLLNYLISKRHTLLGSRNYAMVLTFVITGWHADKVLSLTWRDINPEHDQRDVDAPLSRRCYDAILDHLRRVGRNPEHMLSDEYIWQPVAEASYHNLKYIQDHNLPSNRHVSRQNVAASIRKELRDAGVPNWKRCSIGNLSSAHRFLVVTAHPNPARLQDLLQYTCLDTTCVVCLED